MLYFLSGLLAIVSQLPVVIVLVLGIVMAISRRRQNPAAAVLALVGFAMALLSQLIVISVSALASALPDLLAQAHMSAELLAVVFRFVNLTGSLLAAIGWVLVIVALFRRPRTVSPPAAS